jgi:MoxR-like ATPase
MVTKKRGRKVGRVRVSNKRKRSSEVKKKITPKKKTQVRSKSMFKGSGISGMEREVAFFKKKVDSMRLEISKVVIGQHKVIEDMMTCLFANSSVLLEGVPGIAKTLMIRAMAKTIGCESKRIQFTADLLPTDITGFVAYSRTKGFFVVKGPIFANFVLADEINRAPPKVQSALIEVMQEKQVTIGKKTYHLERPFIVFATENPLENQGVYKLPEAQIDRFLFKVIVDYPQLEEEELIMDQNITLNKFEDYKIKTVISPKDIIRIQELVKKVYVHPKIKRYITEIVSYTRPSAKNDLKLIKYVEWGVSPRASINIYLAARARALMLGRAYVVPQDVKEVVYNVLRHRILLNYHGQVENIKSEDVITDVLSKVKVP